MIHLSWKNGPFMLRVSCRLSVTLRFLGQGSRGLKDLERTDTLPKVLLHHRELQQQPSLFPNHWKRVSLAHNPWGCMAAKRHNSNLLNILLRTLT